MLFSLTSQTEKGIYMYHSSGRRHIVLLFTSLCLACSVFSQTTVPKHKASFNQGWKFIKSDPGTSAANTSYSDASWATVNIPHSPSYDTTNYAGENKAYVGNCWYRKTFTVPSVAKKVFIEFEAATQIADLWLNGTFIGSHCNSGFTSFYFDITNQVSRGQSNVLAIRLNNAKTDSIPPGWASAGPDYFLFGGLNRSVWIHFKDSVYIPVYSQQVWTPNASASSAQVRVRTPVKNDAGTAKSTAVTITLLDAAGATVASKSDTMSIPPATLDTFTQTTQAFTPQLWSPSSPYMYSVRTIVSVNGTVVDSTVEPCGVRFFSWSATNGFSLNGSRLEIKGMCLHQYLGWIESAVPDQRYYYEIKVLKDMGCNSIRCSHYPRAQAFYDACDKLGMLLYVEQPSWGYSMNPTTKCWSRMDSCVKEMILSGRNHPSIYVWGLYNEPNSSSDYSSYIKPINNIAHSLDSTRPTSIANNGSTNIMVIPDLIGMNYSTSVSGTINGINTTSLPWLCCESRNSGTFNTVISRGCALDLDTTENTNTAGTAANEWRELSYTLATSGHLAGGHFWEFKDHNSTWNTDGLEGVVDRLDVPKVMYWYFRQKWTGLAPDYPRPGTATKIDFQSDTNSLPADSVNVFLITATMRDAAGHQISSDSGQVQFTLSDPTKGIIFGGNSAKAYGGKAAAYLRTSKSAGAFTVTATYPSKSSISSATINLTTSAVSPEVYIDQVSAIKSPARISIQPGKLAMNSGAMGFTFRCPASSAGILKIIDIRGRAVFSSAVLNNASVYVKKISLGAGTFYAIWSNAGQHLVVRFSNI
jgi:hypothetical protein